MAAAPTGSLVVGILSLMIFLMLASSLTLAAATSIGDRADPAGQCDLYQPSSPDAANTPLGNQSANLVLHDRIWISVREADFREASWWVSHDNDNDDPDAFPQPAIYCTLLTTDKLDGIPRIAAAIEGADRCKDGTEVCELPSGMSGGGEVEYKLSITREETVSIVEEVMMVTNKAILQRDGKYYLLQLFTTNEDAGLQARLEFQDSHFIGNSTHSIEDEIIRLEKGRSITIPFVVRTFATFGKPANITLVAGVDAQDSGLTTTIEPSTFVIPERSTEKGNLTINAGTTAQDGVYQFFINGKDGWIHTCGMYTYYACPLVQIGDSIWQINTSSGIIGMGGKAPPEWIRLTTETDMDTYRMGEAITIKSYIENDGDEIVTLSGSRLVIDIGNATVYDDPNSSTTALNILYTIDAYPYDGEEDIIIQPHSKVLLVRPFYWNQELGGSLISDEQVLAPAPVQAGNYTIHTSFAGYEGAVMYDSKGIQITPASYGADEIGVPKPEVWAFDNLQLLLIVCAGAIIAGITAFLTIRKRK